MTHTHLFLLVTRNSLLATFLLLFFAALSANAQVQPGTPPFGSFAGGPDVVNLGNLNAHLTIHVINKPGRGTNFTYDLSYDSSVWYPVTSGGATTWHRLTGWTTASPPVMGYATYQITGPFTCRFFQETQWVTEGYYKYTNWIYVDSLGTAHAMIGGIQDGGAPDCGPSDTNVLATNDGSGYKLSVPDETLYNTVGAVGLLNGGTFTDRNGNKVTQSGTTFTDTLGTTALTVTGSGMPSSPKVLTFTPPNTSSSLCSATNTAGVACYVISYVAYTVKSNFGCSGVSEYPATVNNLVDKITLSDGSYYQFTYEVTPGSSGDVTGRLASVRLPTGGTISYTYTSGGLTGSAVGSNDPIVCADGSAAGLTRQTPDGTWTYSRTQVSGNHWQTKVTTPPDPANSPTVGDDTVIDFQEDSNTTTPTNNSYEAQRVTYQGASSSNVVLQTLSTCYNGAASPCTATSVATPITQRTIIDQFGSSGLQCEHNFLYYNGGGLTEQDDYDYGSGAPGALLRQTLITYASLGNITAFRQQVTVKNGSGTVVAQKNYNYDENTPAATSGIAQHGSVSGSRGNLTSINYPVNGLTSHFTYWDTASPNTAQDVNGATTTYNYSSNTASCQMAFPTSVTEPVSNMSQSYSWNCNGGVQLTRTDENGKTTTATYANDKYYWRADSVADPTNASVNSCYGLLSSAGTCTLNPTQVESTLNFNSNNSTVDTLTTFDGLGRVHIQQKRQSPTATTFDSVETDYDSLGRVNRVTLPYSGAAGQTCPPGPSCPAITTTYDALNRFSQVTDAGGGTTTYSPYSNNDVLITVGPPPPGETAKQRQLEYDGLGRLTSVCEITAGTSAWPGGTCSQNSSQTGYWTKYAYDVLGHLLAVTQNAQATSANQQTRTYTYDAMGRLTSEKNPETNQVATSYTYDTDTTCTPASSGDMVKRVDAVGNTICYAYDALHRITSMTYPSGTYASSTPAKTFVYDSATVNGVAMANVKGRLAEAYTGLSSSKTTDLGFSYTSRGEVSDAYELAPHSNSSYYHVSQSYWPHGALYQLSTGISGLPTVSYGGTIGSTVGLDGEGRVTQVTAGSGQNPVTGVSYNNSSLPTQVNFGSGDSDIFAYDSKTLRMTQYKFNVGTQSQSLTGSLTWNANSSLGQLAIIDQFNSADTQTCNYSHDDLVRIISANCGTAAAQTFSYDPFGNINKSGSPNSFQPNYSVATNRMTSLPGNFTPTYDANGNVTNDSNHTYSWDADGNSIMIDSVGLTFDALDRMVEQNRSGTYTEIVYTPTGGKLALMTGTGGQTLQKAFVPLPGQVTAIYTSSGLDHYRHSDWLGSARLSSTTSRTVSSTVAYAPFGETYASSTADPSFTGENQDTVPGDYDFLFREYSNEGRWTSPDPAGLVAVDPADPQSWNRYAYVRNRPLMLIDPLGLDCVYFNPDGSISEVKPADCYSETDDGYYVDGTILGGAGGITVSDDGNWMFYSYTPYDQTFTPSGLLGGGQCIGDCGANSTVIVFGGITPVEPSSAPNPTYIGPYTPPVQSGLDLWHMTPQQRARVSECMATGGEFGGESIEPPEARQSSGQVRDSNGKPAQYPGNNKPIIPNIKGAKRTPEVTGLAGGLEFLAGAQACIQNVAGQ
jgi:RHS repeat-associated protein